MLLNAKAKGSRRERAVRDIYLKRGYDVVKAAGSLGMFDLVTVFKYNNFALTSDQATALIQVKSNRIPPLEVQVIADHQTTARKEIWIKKDHQPWMMCVIDEPLEETASPGCVLPNLDVQKTAIRGKLFAAEKF